MTETTECPEDWSEEWIEIHKLGREQGMKTIQNVTSLQKKLITDLSDQIKNLRSEVTSLTKERDRLKEKLSVRLSFQAVMENKNKIIDKLEIRLSKAEEENKELEEKLSELTHGIPIEKADKKKRYQHINSYGNMAAVIWRDDCWRIKVGAIDDRRTEWLKFTGTHVYPLPSQTQEGS